MRRNPKKGQAAVTDLFIAISVFIILITIMTLTWNLYNLRLQNRFDYDDMMTKAFQVSDVLIKSKGNPVDWETDPNSTIVIGLSSNDRIISKTKVETFTDEDLFNESKLKDILKVNQFNYYFVLRHLNGTLIHTRGLFPSGNLAINLARLVLYDDIPVFLEFAVWK